LDSKSKGEKIMSTVTCPECEAEITLDAGTEAGEIIVCSDCGVDLEVTSVDPATVQLAPMEQEDWGE
jgi:alpha-aminoadipate carrier protein LysW